MTLSYRARQAWTRFFGIILIACLAASVCFCLDYKDKYEAAQAELLSISGGLGAGASNNNEKPLPADDQEAQSQIDVVDTAWPHDGYVFENPSDLFAIENLEIAQINNFNLGSEVTILFDFISNSSLDSHRDVEGVASMNATIEYSQPDAPIISHPTHSFGIADDGRYHITIFCPNTHLTTDRITSIVFTEYCGEFSVVKTVE